MFAALAAHGHTYPSIPLAVAAREAGHQVFYAGGEQFQRGLLAAGLHPLRAGMRIRDAFAELAGRSGGQVDVGRMTGRVLGEVLPRRWVSDLGPLVERHRPDLVIYDAATIGAGLAAAIAGVPALCHGFGRMSAGMSDGLVSSFCALAAEHGADGAAVLGASVLDICPESVQSRRFLARADRIPLRPVGWSEPGGHAAQAHASHASHDPAGLGHRDRSRPLVYVSLGTAFATAGLLGTIVDAITPLPVDVLVAAGPAVPVTAVTAVTQATHFAGATRDAGATVRVEAWVPQVDVLPHADLVVHHGGSGTMLGAFAAGRPQLLLPQGADHFDNAAAVVLAGAGASIPPGEATPEAITAAVRGLLAGDSADAAMAAARRLAAEVAAMPAPREVATRLPGIAGE